MKRFPFFIVGILVLSFTSLSYSQSEEGEMPQKGKAVFISGISPIILSQGEVEAGLSTSLVSYWNILKGLSSENVIINNAYRLSISQTQAQVFYGFSTSQKWDLGAELIYTARRFDDRARSSPFKVFNSDNLNKKGLSMVGLKVRSAPVSDIPELTLQLGVRFPIANGDALRRELGAQRTQINLNANYLKYLNHANSYFLTAGWGFHLPFTPDAGGLKNNAIHILSAGAYLSINVINQRLYLIPGLSFSGNFQKSASSGQFNNLTQAMFVDAVVQLQLRGNLNLTLQQSLPVLFESYLPLVEFERRSFSATALGLRMFF